MGHIFTDSGFTIVSSQLKYRPAENSSFHPSVSDSWQNGDWKRGTEIGGWEM